MSQSFPKARVKTEHPYLVMMGLYLGAFTGMFSETSLNIAIPQLMKAFRVDTGIAQWLVIGYMLVIGITLPLASFLMKRFPTRNLTVFSLGVFIIGSLLSGSANQFGILLAGRMIQGIGTGLILPMMFSVVLEVFPPHKIGSALGVAALVIMFAPAIGPTLSGMILGMLSWRWIFFCFVIILTVALIFTLIYMVNPYQLIKPKIDVLSCLTSAIGFGGIVLAVGLSSECGLVSVPVIVPLAIGILAIVFYSKRQLSIKNPILDLRALSISGFRLGTLLVMIDFGITLSAMYLLPQYIQNGLRIPVAMTGLIMLPAGVINALVSFFSGRLYDRIGAKFPARLGFFISIVGAAMFCFTTANSPVAYIIACHIILMIGVPLAMSPSQTAGLHALPQHLSTDGSTIINTMQQVVGAICTAIATCLLGFGETSGLSAGEKAANAFVTGTHYGFYFTLVLAILGFILSFRIQSGKTKEENTKYQSNAKDSSQQISIS